MKRTGPLKQRFALTGICALFLVVSTPAMGIIESVHSLAAKKAATIDLLHRKARKALVNAAQDKTFPSYFHSRNHEHKHTLKKKIDQLSLAVQRRFHVEEMCLINPHGEEISRIVKNEIAHDLSDEEAGAPFFKPGFALEPRTVYTSPIYMSPDVDRWVVAYVTPVVVDRHVRAILHYEHGLDFYQQAVNRGVRPDPDHYVLTVNEHGLVLSDSRQNIGVDSNGSSEEMSEYFQPFKLAGFDLEHILNAIDNKQDIIGTDGSQFRAAYRRVDRWIVLAIKKV